MRICELEDGVDRYFHENVSSQSLYFGFSGVGRIQFDGNLALATQWSWRIMPLKNAKTCCISRVLEVYGVFLFQELATYWRRSEHLMPMPTRKISMSNISKLASGTRLC